MYSWLRIIIFQILICISFPALATDSANTTTTNTLVNLLFSRGLYHSAVMILRTEKAKGNYAYIEESCCKDSAAMWSDFNKTCESLKSKGKWKEVIKKYEERMMIYPDDLQIVLRCMDAIAQILSEQKEFDKAINIYNQIRLIGSGVKETKKGVPSSFIVEILMHQRIAEIYEKQGLYSKAIDEYEMILGLVKAPGIYEKYFKNDAKKDFDEGITKWQAKIKELKPLKDTP